MRLQGVLREWMLMTRGLKVGTPWEVCVHVSGYGCGCGCGCGCEYGCGCVSENGNG